MATNKLFIDGSGKVLTVAAINKDNKMASMQDAKMKETLEQLFPIIDKVSSELGLKYHDYDEIYVTLGPGSNTGLRMTITQARVFFALKPSVNIFAETTFEVLFRASGLAEGIVLISDRHGSLFFADYDNGIRTLSGHAESIKDIPNTTNKAFVFASEDTACGEIEGLNAIKIPMVKALTLPSSYKKYTPDNIQNLVPFYNDKL